MIFDLFINYTRLTFHSSPNLLRTTEKHVLGIMKYKNCGGRKLAYNVILTNLKYLSVHSPNLKDPCILMFQCLLILILLLVML